MLDVRLMTVTDPQVYRRLRGTLFFGPGFAVTKNKLTFCDALDQTLAGAEPGEEALLSALTRVCQLTCAPALSGQAFAHD